MALDRPGRPPVPDVVSRSPDAAIKALEDRIGHRFASADLLGRALTHDSAAAELSLGPTGSYQRLEFLGDRVLALVVAEMLSAAHPQAAEGELARRLNALVRNETCAEVAQELGIGEALLLGEGEARSGGRTKATILGDVCEAVIGAIYLDGGLEPARQLIERQWSPRMANLNGPLRDAKSALQEWMQGRGLPPPLYAVVGQSGPHHAPRFVVSVELAGYEPGRGEGSSKREAEQGAAREVLIREGMWKASQ